MKIRKLIIALSIVVVLCMVVGFSLNTRLSVTTYVIDSETIESPVRVVLLTDLHSYPYGSAQQDLISRINALKPDVVAMSGDIMDDYLPDQAAIELITGIADKYRCYYVTGNHEYWSGRAEQQKDTIRRLGVTVLEGTRDDIEVNGQKLSIRGVDDPEVGPDFLRQLEDVSDGIDEATYTILLSHRPEYFQTYTSRDFDLVLSGHAHGGQLRIPLLLPNGLFAPNQGWFPSYTTGIYEDNGTKMLVSRGLVVRSYVVGSMKVPRIFNPPELVVIDLV